MGDFNVEPLTLAHVRHLSVATALLAAGTLLAAPRHAHAGPFEVQGVGPVGVAEVNARAARADDGTAAFYNPGGLGFGRGVRLTVAPMVGVSTLKAQGRTLPLADPVSVALAFDATLPLTGALADRIRFGFAASFMPSGALHLVARPASEPFFPYYDNRTQRLVLMPALSVRVMDKLAVGVGLNVLGGVDGPASVRPGASGAPESRLDLEATTTVAVNAGVRFDPTESARFAGAFRQRFAVPSRVATTAEIAGVPLDVTVGSESALYDPMTIIVATSFDLGRATIEIDASYAVWSAYAGPFAAVSAELPGVHLGSDLPVDIARDVVSVRAAGSYRLDVGRAELALRGGGGFEPTMLSSKRQGRTNLVDGDKVLAGLGATLALRNVPKIAALHFGVGASAQVVLPSVQDKRVCAARPCGADTVVGPDAANPSAGITNPGFPRLEGGGALWTASIGVGVDL